MISDRLAAKSERLDRRNHDAHRTMSFTFNAICTIKKFQEQLLEFVAPRESPLQPAKAQNPLVSRHLTIETPP
jgi:hypothetical protein